VTTRRESRAGRACRPCSNPARSCCC